MARTIQSLERAAAVLRLLGGGARRLGLSEIATALGLAKGTAHGLLRTLQHEGLVEQDGESGKYQLGAELLRLGHGYLEAHELRARAVVWAEDLARTTGESVYLGVAHLQGVLVVHHVSRPDAGRQVLEVGTVQPLHSTALGKALAAHDPAVRGTSAADGRTAFTPRTVTHPAECEAELELTRTRGWATDLEETWVGVASVAAAVQDRRQVTVGAVGVTGAVERICGADGVQPRLVAAVRDCARSLSRDLGAGRF